VYVDDILVASRDIKQISSLKKYLRSSFEITSRGEVKHCLGMEFVVNQGEISRREIRQSAYIRDILERFGISECKAVYIPMESGLRPKVNDDEEILKNKSFPYRELVGALMYLFVHHSRPDISFSVSYLSQFCNNYRKEYWTMTKRIFRYLKGTANVGLTYHKTDRSLHGFVDADWANCQEDRRSYTGYTFVLAVQ